MSEMHRRLYKFKIGPRNEQRKLRRKNRVVKELQVQDTFSVFDSVEISGTNEISVQQSTKDKKFNWSNGSEITLFLTQPKTNTFSRTIAPEDN